MSDGAQFVLVFDQTIQADDDDIVMELPKREFLVTIPNSRELYQELVRHLDSFGGETLHMPAHCRYGRKVQFHVGPGLDFNAEVRRVIKTVDRFLESQLVGSA